MRAPPRRRRDPPAGRARGGYATSRARYAARKYGTKDAMDRLTHFTAKLNITDRARVAAAIAHYEPHIDFDRLLQE